MNDCEKYMELMSQMLDGELPAEQAEALRTHIETCPECRQVYGAFQNVSEALSGELTEPPEMLSKGVMFKIRNQKKTPPFCLWQVYGAGRVPGADFARRGEVRAFWRRDHEYFP